MFRVYDRPMTVDFEYANTHFEELVDIAADREPVEITRLNKPSIWLVPVDDSIPNPVESLHT
jgi:prevent-host-death family protein